VIEATHAATLMLDRRILNMLRRPLPQETPGLLVGKGGPILAECFPSMKRVPRPSAVPWSKAASCPPSPSCGVDFR
jgi:hypothetical protein